MHTRGHHHRCLGASLAAFVFIATRQSANRSFINTCFKLLPISCYFIVSYLFESAVSRLASSDSQPARHLPSHSSASTTRRRLSPCLHPDPFSHTVQSTSPVQAMAGRFAINVPMYVYRCDLLLPLPTSPRHDDDVRVTVQSIAYDNQIESV